MKRTHRGTVTRALPTRFRIPMLLLIAWGGCISAARMSAGIPTNDLFKQRILLVGTAVSADGGNWGAAREIGEPFHNDEPDGKSVWWSWVAPEKGFATLSTLGSSFDTVLAVYTGASVTSLTRVAANDDGAPDFTSRLTFPVVAGQTYQIAVDGYADGGIVDSGSIRLRLDYAKQFLAPAWNLKDLDGKAVASSDFAGKVVLLNFWATWCGPCVSEMPGLVALQSRYRDRGFTVVGVSLDAGGASVVRPFVPQHHLNYPIVMSDDRIDTDFGGIEFIPTSFLVDREGNLIEKWVGYTDEAEFESSILPVLGPAELPPANLTWHQGRLLLSWPADQAGVAIESAESVLGPWATAAVSGVATNGRFEAILAPSGTRGFLRLRR